MECVQCGAEYRRGGAAQGKRCEPCVIANRTGICIDCGELVVRVPGRTGTLAKRCDPCWVANKRRLAEAARQRRLAQETPEEAALRREKAREQVARWRADNPERTRERDRKMQAKRWADPDTRMHMKALRADRRYGLGSGGYLALLHAQDYSCAICHEPFMADRRLSVDHDHLCCPERMRSCGACVRGLLCDNCNTGLGRFKDDPALLRAAADYLEAR